MSDKRFDDYLEQLSAELAPLPKEERAAILSEIHNHIDQALEEGDVDLLKELGDPAQLAVGMQRIYRPKRLTDFLLAIVPSLLLPMLSTLVVARFYSHAEIPRLSQLLLVLTFLPFILISLRRPTPELQLFWLGTGLLTTLSAAAKNPLTIGTQYGISWFETAGYIGLSIVLGVLFGRTVRDNQDDSLLLTWAGLPFVAAFLGLVSRIYAARILTPAAFGESAMLTGYLSILLLPIIYALFFLPTRRRYRWLALGGFVAMKIVIMGHLFWPVLWTQPIFMLAAIILVAMVGIGFWRDQPSARLDKLFSP